MATNQKDEQMAVLKELCSNDALPKTREVVEQEDVVMKHNGSLAYANGNPKETELRRRRKELVLGMNGCDEHTLEEANDILSSRKDSPLSRIREVFSGRKI